MELQEESVKGMFATPEASVTWSDTGRYDPASNEGPYNYNDKIYRMIFVLDELPDAPSPDAKAIDFGCGAGPFLPGLHAKGYKVTGFDNSEHMIEQARQVCEKAGFEAELVVGDAFDNGFADNAFDVACSVGVVEHFTSDVPVLKELHRIVKPGGTVVITMRNFWCPHVRYWTLYRTIAYNLRKLKAIIAGKPLTAKELNRPYDSREHTTRQFYHSLREAGFEPQGVRFNHYYFLPYPLDRHPRLSGIERFMAKKQEKLSKTFLGWLGSTSIFTAKCIK